MDPKETLATLWRMAALRETALPYITLTGADPVLPSSFRVGEAAQSISDITDELQSEIDALSAKYDPAAMAVDVTDIKPKRGGVDVQLVALAWRAH